MKTKMGLHLAAIVLAIGGVLYGAQNCGQLDQQQAAMLKTDGVAGTNDSIFVVCACNDLACWRQQTTKRSYDSFKCAKDALGAAFPLVDIIGSIAFAAIEIDAATTDLRTIVGSLQEASAAIKAVKELNGGCVAAVTSVTGDFNGILTKGLQVADKSKTLSDGLRAGTVSVMDVTDIARAGADTVIAIGKVLDDVVKLEDCTDLYAAKIAADPTRIKSTLQGAKELLTKASDPWKKLSVVAKLDVANKITGCGISIFRGAYALGNNTYCLNRDLQAVYESNKAVAKALAYVGSRQFNNAKYVGCTECLKDSSGTFSNNGEQDYNDCRQCCSDRGASFIPGGFEQKRASWVTSCQLSCAVARTESSVGRDPYTNDQLCADVRNVFAVSRFYRHINLVDVTLQGAARVAAAEEVRGTVLKHIDTLRANFAALDTADSNGGGGPDGIASFGDFQAMARRTDLTPDLAEALSFFTTFAPQPDLDNYPYYFALLDGASVDGARDGRVGTTDLDYFRGEIAEYRDESEFGAAEQP